MAVSTPRRSGRAASTPAGRGAPARSRPIWVRIWVAWSWLSLVVLLVAVVAVPSLRPGARVALWCWCVLALWFALARTKTLTWWFVCLAGLAGALVAPLVGLACVAVAGPLGLDVNERDAAVVLGPVEEFGKLLPLAALLVVARSRVRRFAVVDFLLVGLASGLGFQAVEDGLRRVWWTTGSAASAAGTDNATGLAQYGLGLLPGWHEFPGQAFWPGHHVTTALVALGFGVAWWWRPRAGRLMWLLPAALLAVACVDHAMTNAVAFRVAGVPSDSHQVDPPGWLVALWDAWGNGAQQRPLLVSGLLVAIMLDVRRARRVRYLLVPLPGGGWTRAVIGEAERICRWLLGRSSERPPGWQRWTLQAAVPFVRLVAWSIVDLGHEATVLATAARRGPRRRRSVPRRRRLAETLTLLRQRRELAQELGRDVDRAAAPPRSGTTTLFGLAAGTLVVAGFLAFALMSGGEAELFMAGLFSEIAAWWGGLAAPEQVLAVAGGAALLTLGGAGRLDAPGVASAEDLLDSADGASGARSARVMVTSLTPAEAAAAVATLTLARAAPRARRPAAELDELLDAVAAPGFMARRAANLAQSGRLLGRPPVGAEHAGLTLRLADPALAARYPHGVRFTTFGFPEFAPYAVATVQLDGIAGDPADEVRANAAAGFPATPEGHAWHRVEDCRTMQLVPANLHEAVAHDGGGVVARARGDAVS